MKTAWVEGVETQVSDLGFAALFPLTAPTAVYQQVNLNSGAAIGTPGPLPAQLLGLSDAQLADLDKVSDPLLSGYAGQGFWVVVFTTPPFDATTQVPDGTATVGAPDPATKTVSATKNLRALTTVELAAALANAQAEKLLDLSTACAAQIVAGYSSSALGALHSYPSKDADQANMAASVLDAQRVPPAWQPSMKVGLLQDVMAGGHRLLCSGAGTTGTTAPTGPGSDASVTWATWTTPFWCADANGTWSFQPHTAAQIQQAGADGKIAILTAQQKLAGLKADITAATTADQVNALSW